MRDTGTSERMNRKMMKVIVIDSLVHQNLKSDHELILMII
jgi:hypothetical protein